MFFLSMIDMQFPVSPRLTSFSKRFLTSVVRSTRRLLLTASALLIVHALPGRAQTITKLSAPFTSPDTATYTLSLLGIGWDSPSSTYVDNTGIVWVADYSAQEIYQPLPNGDVTYTQQQFIATFNFQCLRVLTVSKSEQLFGLEAGGGVVAALVKVERAMHRF